MKLVAVTKRVAGYKVPIDPGQEFMVDDTLGHILIERGEAHLPGQERKVFEPVPPVVPKVVTKKETAVAPTVEAR
jgi:hypothetical protein